MKLHKLALTASERQEILVMLLQPIVISNKPLIKAEQISFVSPKEENKKQVKIFQNKKGRFIFLFNQL